jgi:hypothetical protein
MIITYWNPYQILLNKLLFIVDCIRKFIPSRKSHLVKRLKVRISDLVSWQQIGYVADPELPIPLHQNLACNESNPMLLLAMMD